MKKAVFLILSLFLLLFTAVPLTASAFSPGTVSVSAVSAVACFFEGVFGVGCSVEGAPNEQPNTDPLVLASGGDTIRNDDPPATSGAEVVPPTIVNNYYSSADDTASSAQSEELRRILAQMETLIGAVSGSIPLTQGALDDKIDTLEAKINALPSRTYPNSSDNSTVWKIVSLVNGTDIEDATLTDPIITGGTLSGTSILGTLAPPRLSVSGTSSFTGRTSFGTTSAQDVLTLEGALYLANNTPSANTNRLYNTNGDLYWNGNTLLASTTGTWSASAGNVSRATGRVGIGTISPTAVLEVIGNVIAGTTTAPIYDAGGEVCNVKAYGAVGDDSTDNYAAINAAINDCPVGGTVLFPMGVYRIGQTLVIDKPVTLRGTYAPRWHYSSTPRSSIKPTPTFVGTSIVHVRDNSISGEANNNNGGRFVNMSIDGNSYGTGIEGLYFEGLLRDWKLQDVDISQTSGDGFHAARGAGSGNPRGFTIRGLSIYSPEGHGFRATALNDSYLQDVLVVGGALRGFYLSSIGETKIVGSRAVFNALEGLYIDGSSNNGGLQISDFSTDRNDRHGVRISASGTTSIAFNGLLTRRDGANAYGGSETPYAGVAIIGSSTEMAAPVIINNLTQIVGVNDGGGGTLSPAVGVRVEYGTYTNIDGVLWGVSNSYLDNGNNTTFIIKEDALLRTGSNATLVESRYNQKWVTASGTLTYTNGDVGIGTSSPSYKMQVVRTGDGNVAGFTDDNGTCTINPTNTALICSSDENLKKDIHTIPDALPRLLELRGVNFKWRAQEEGDDRFGFIAQEIEPLFPELVMEDTRGYKMVNIQGITPVIVESIKELNLKVDDLIAGAALVGGLEDNGLSLSDIPEAIGAQIKKLGVAIYDGVLRAKRLIADDEICIGETCMSEGELAALLETVSISDTTAVVQESQRKQEDTSGQEEETQTAATSSPIVATSTPMATSTAPATTSTATSTATSTDDTTQEPSQSDPQEFIPNPVSDPEETVAAPSDTEQTETDIGASGTSTDPIPPAGSDTGI